MINKDLPALLSEAYAALHRGDLPLARQKAHKVVSIDPECVQGWLILAGLSNPEVSLYYARKAQAISPDNPWVIKALHWAQQRCEDKKTSTSLEATRKVRTGHREKVFILEPPIRIETHLPVWIWTFVILLILTLIFLGLDFVPLKFVSAVERAGPISQETIAKPCLTPTATLMPTPTPIPTLTPIPTVTPTATPSSTPAVQPTATAVPTSTELPEELEGRWIAVDLSEQRLYAYQDDDVVRSFIVSTGTWDHPTLVGRFAVWIKLRYTDMAGPGYYLPNVPYTMYFYSGYGIHGTYWHNNFGTPMSHGCVNMVTEEAGWLYNWSFVGIPVVIQD